MKLFKYKNLTQYIYFLTSSLFILIFIDIILSITLNYMYFNLMFISGSLLIASIFIYLIIIEYKLKIGDLIRLMIIPLFINFICLYIIYKGYELRLYEYYIATLIYFLLIIVITYISNKYLNLIER